MKNCPITDKNNEILLDVVLSVMEFSKEEIIDLLDMRKKGIRSNSVSGGTLESEEAETRGRS